MGGGGEGGEGGDCGSEASIRISWVMVYRVQEVGKALKGVDYSLHCSSAFKSKIESTRIPSEKKKMCTLGYTVNWGKGEKIRHHIVGAWGDGAGGEWSWKIFTGLYSIRSETNMRFSLCYLRPEPVVVKR